MNGLEISEITIKHIRHIYANIGKKNYFGRKDIERITKLKSSRASEIIKIMLNHKIIYPVSGSGNDKYKFYKRI